MTPLDVTDIISNRVVPLHLISSNRTLREVIAPLHRVMPYRVLANVAALFHRTRRHLAAPSYSILSNSIALLYKINIKRGQMARLHAMTWHRN